MGFQEFLLFVRTLAKSECKVHLLPSTNDLYILWEQKLTPAQVVNECCK